MTEERLKDYADIKAELLQLERLRGSSIEEARRIERRGWFPHYTTNPIHLELVALYDGKIAAAKAELQAVEEAIAAVPDDTARELLQLRYLKGMTWDAVSLAMCYSYTNVHRLHRKALAML